MNNSHIRIEHILFFALYLAILFALWQTFKESIKILREQVKRRLPRKLKPRSPKDCPNCQSGVKLAILKPKCDYFGVIDHLLHAVVGDGKRGIDKHIQYWKCQWCDKRFTSRLHTPLYRLKTDEGNIVLVLMLLAEGCE